MSAAIRCAAAALVVGLLAGQVAWGHSDEQKSGTHWLRKCTNPEPAVQIECAIYVRALVEYDELRGKTLEQKRLICPEKGLTIGASREVVVKYLRERPGELHLPFVLLAHRALAAAFPCPADAATGSASAPPSR